MNDALLERIAVALEKLATATQTVVVAEPAQQVLNVLTEAQAPQTETREQPAPAEAPKRGRGRPPKSAYVEAVLKAEKEKEAASVAEVLPAPTPPPEESVISFLDEAAPAEAAAPTSDNVKQALVDLLNRKVNGGMPNEDARKLVYGILFKDGNRADRLPGSPKDKEAGAGTYGALKSEYFQAVIDAAGKA